MSAEHITGQFERMLTVMDGKEMTVRIFDHGKHIGNIGFQSAEHALRGECSASRYASQQQKERAAKVALYEYAVSAAEQLRALLEDADAGNKESAEDSRWPDAHAILAAIKGEKYFTERQDSVTLHTYAD